jgi:hypothetical protein
VRVYDYMTTKGKYVGTAAFNDRVISDVAFHDSRTLVVAGEGIFRKYVVKEGKRELLESREFDDAVVDSTLAYNSICYCHQTIVASSPQGLISVLNG